MSVMKILIIRQTEVQVSKNYTADSGEGKAGVNWADSLEKLFWQMEQYKVGRSMGVQVAKGSTAGAKMIVKGRAEEIGRCQTPTCKAYKEVLIVYKQW